MSDKKEQETKEPEIDPQIPQNAFWRSDRVDDTPKPEPASIEVHENPNYVPGEISEQKVIDALMTVYDPELPVNVYDLGLIYKIDLYDDGRVEIEMSLTAPNCPSAQELPAMVRDAVEEVEHVKSVKVTVVWDPPWDVSRMSEVARLTLNMF